MSASAVPLQELVERLERFYGVLPQPPREPFPLYVWEILGVHSSPARRELAISALRKIPALTPDSLALLPRNRLEEAVRLAGPYLEERIRALLAGAAAFRRDSALGDRLQQPLEDATRALAAFPYLSTASGQWMLLLAGGHPVIPADPGLVRVALRLGCGAPDDDVARAVASAREAVAAALGDDVEAIRRAAVYLTHHGLTTCEEADPHCGVCPLRDACGSAVAGGSQR